ncbi:integrin beta-1-binding protein 1-like isoform X1 [Oncorhynchus nerka]|uniref:integrin beta-1-binding protein 1-like isoform X1 n=1 Tax=Oncorhynchus nerka TaxID=8023 RepID=UPI001131689B|nr:integrin beta-1-binding protein 1-like isoform X1 [Oncorhynchus nerka]
MFRKVKKHRSSSQSSKISTKSKDVLQHHPLYLSVRMLCYNDGLGSGKNLLTLKTTDAKQQECSIWVYQWSSAVNVCEQGQAICRCCPPRPTVC